jgi:hypothetical protein
LCYDIEEGEERVTYRYGCPLVDHEGRCSGYAKRPDTCFIFVPGAGEICPYYGIVNNGGVTEATRKRPIIDGGECKKRDGAPDGFYWEPES